MVYSYKINLDEKMKITLIVPAIGRRESEPYMRGWQMEPMAIAVLKSLTPSDIEVEFFDDRVEQIPYELETDLVGISIETFTAKRGYELAERFRAKGHTIVLGGFHVALMPEEARNYADSIVIGQAEDLWPVLIEDLKAGNLKKEYKCTKDPDLSGIIPDRSLFKDKPYLPISLIEFTRGCFFDCEFCSVCQFFDHKCNTRKVDDFVKEFKKLKSKYYFIIDDNIIADIPRSKELFRALIPLNIKWVSQASINVASDVELLDLMRKSGCEGLLIGFESLNAENLHQMNKNININVESHNEALSRIRSYGMTIYGTFVFGYDNDDLDSFKPAYDFAVENKFFLVAFNQVTPFPGTPLYDRLESENRLFHEKWWLGDDVNFGEVYFQPKKLTKDQLAYACFLNRKKFYSIPSLIKRIDFSTNFKDPYFAFIFLSQNLLARREIYKRWKLPIGRGLDLPGKLK